MAKSDAERGPRAAWIVRHRKRLFGTNVHEFAEALKNLGHEFSVTTIRGWETGARPGPEAREKLEQLFGEPMPQDRQPVAPEELMSVLQAQTAAINDLVAELRLHRETEMAVAEGTKRALEVLAGRLPLGEALGSSPEPPPPGTQL